MVSKNLLLLGLLVVLPATVAFLSLTFGGGGGEEIIVTTTTSLPSSTQLKDHSRDITTVEIKDEALLRFPSIPAAKECTLSQFASQVNLRNRMATVLCPQYCSSKNNSGKSSNVTVITPPAFCRVEKREEMVGSRVRFDFGSEGRIVFNSNIRTQHEQQTTGTTLILCAIGKRFYGPGGQGYVVEAIRQWRLFHRSTRERGGGGGGEQPDNVYLILDEEFVQDEKMIAMATKYRVVLVSSQSLMSESWKRYLKVFYIQGYMHPGGSRKTGNKNFNQHVSERFYAIASLMQKKGLRHVVHMENDVMVYGNLEKVVTAAKHCGIRLASTIASTKGFIPGVMYIREWSDMDHLANFISDLLSCGAPFGAALQKGYANDMTYLLNYYQFFGSDYLSVMPSWEHAEGDNCISDVHSLTRVVEEQKKRKKNSDKELHSGAVKQIMFDAASFGQWLSNSVNSSDLRPPKQFRDAMKGRFVDATPPPSVIWKPLSNSVYAHDDDGDDKLHHSSSTTFLSASESHPSSSLLIPVWKEKYHLLSLHVHAKNLHEFRSDDPDLSVRWQAGKRKKTMPN